MKEERINWKVCVRCFTYNHSGYIIDTLNGFCIQETDFPYVCTIVDDASIDGEQEVIRKYLEENFALDDRDVSYEKETDYAYVIYAQHKTNKNCYFVVLFLKQNHYSNPSIKRKKFEYISEWYDNARYIALCEGDDYWIDPLKLQKQVDFLERNPKISYVFTGRQIHDERKNIIIQQTYRRKLYTTSDILAGFNPGIQSVCFKKECIDGINFSSYLGINGDRLIPYLCSLKGKLAAINDVTAVYRKTGLGVSTKIADDAWFEHASLDFYKFHKILSFPNMNSYYKGEARYILAQLKKSSLIEIYKSLKNINEKITIINFISMLFFSVVLLTKKCFQWKIRKIIKDEIQ